MRTTIRLDDELLKATKARAARTGQSMTAVIEQALRESFTRIDTSRASRSTHLPTVGGNGLQSGVDLDDGAALMELMDADRR